MEPKIRGGGILASLLVIWCLCEQAKKDFQIKHVGKWYTEFQQYKMSFKLKD